MRTKDDFDDGHDGPSNSWRTIFIVMLVEALVIGAIVFAGTHNAFGAL